MSDLLGGYYTAWPYERKCPICGKMFVMHSTEEWGYTVGSKRFCTYSCLRKYERKQEENRRKVETKPKARRISTDGMSPEQRKIIVAMYMKMGSTNREIAELTGMDQELVNYYRRKVESEEALKNVRR